jgi:hypothetical protein
MPDYESMSITFRFPKAILEDLKEEAEHKKISINALLNQIAASHVEWHAHATKAGFITVRRGLVKNIFDKLTEQHIDELAKASAEEMKDVSLLMVRRDSQGSLLEFMERWIRTSDFGYRHIVGSNSLHTYIIQHDMGYNWSYYLSRLFFYASEDVAIFKPEIRISKESFVLKIKKK